MTLRGPIAPSIMKTHPLTGEPIEPVGVVGNKYVWPVMGGAPVDDEDAPPSGQASGGRSDNAKDKSARQQQLRGRFQSLNR